MRTNNGCHFGVSKDYFPYAIHCVLLQQATLKTWSFRHCLCPELEVFWCIQDFHSCCKIIDHSPDCFLHTIKSKITTTSGMDSKKHPMVHNALHPLLDVQNLPFILYFRKRGCITWVWNSLRSTISELIEATQDSFLSQLPEPEHQVLM